MNGLTRRHRAELSILPGIDKLFALHDHLDRMFENPLAELRRGAEFLRVWNPAIDLYEDAENVIVRAELPGMKKEDIDVSLHDGELTISGERKSEEKSQDVQTHRSERFVGAFQRSLTLPTFIKADQVKAHYQDGILTVTLPKAEEAKRKQIEVKIN